MRSIFFLRLFELLWSNDRPKALVTATTKKHRDIAVAMLSLLSAGLLVLSLPGCAEWNYTEINHTPESPYDVYYGPDYYPYYPYYSYYGGAYY
jgi:hypothetical protein